MAWVTWRQHRVALTGVAALMGALAVFFWIAGLQLHHAYVAATACHPAGSIVCGDLINTINGMNGFLRNGLVLQAVPALIGAFVGAPVLAREIESGTFRFAWTQGFGRWRWTIAKLVALGVVVAAAAGALGVLMSWYYQPYFAAGNKALPLQGRLDRGVPVRSRPVRPARGHVRRLDAGRLRDRRPGRYRDPPDRPRDCRHPGRLRRASHRGRRVPTPGLPGATGHQHAECGRFRVDRSQQWSPGGRPVSQSVIDRVLSQGGPLAVGKGGIPQSFNTMQYLARHGYTQLTTYQPASRFWPFQWIEGGWLLALSVLLIAVTVWSGPPARGLTEDRQARVGRQQLDARRRKWAMTGRSGLPTDSWTHRPPGATSALSRPGPQEPYSVAEPFPSSETRGARVVRSRRQGRSLRRFALILGAGTVVIILVATLHGVFGNADSFPVPSQAHPCRLEPVPAHRGHRREPGRVQHRTFQLLLQQVQRLLGRRHGGLPERRDGRGVVRRLCRLGLAGGRSAVHLRLRPGRDQRRRRQLL